METILSTKNFSKERGDDTIDSNGKVNKYDDRRPSDDSSLSKDRRFYCKRMLSKIALYMNLALYYKSIGKSFAAVKYMERAHILEQNLVADLSSDHRSAIESLHSSVTVQTHEVAVVPATAASTMAKVLKRQHNAEDNVTLQASARNPTKHAGGNECGRQSDVCVWAR